MNGRNTSRSTTNGIPASKRPRVGDSPQLQNHLAVGNKALDDPFDDCFTGDELLELEFVASQAEGKTPHIPVVKNMLESSNHHFKAPLPTTITSLQKTSSSLNFKDTDDSVANLQKRCFEYEKEVRKLREEIGVKSGEVRLLRDKKNDIEKVLHDERQARHLAEQTKKDEKLKSEIALEKKHEQCKDQLEFKQVELQEAQNLIRNLELKNKSLLGETSVTRARIDILPSSQGCGETFSQKKVKFVKPESPRILTKKAHSSKQEATTPTKTSCAVSHKRRRKTMLSPRQDCRFGLWSHKDTILMHQLCGYFRENDRESHEYADGADAISRLLASTNSEVTDKSRVLGSIVMTALFHALHSHHSFDQQQGTHTSTKLSPTPPMTSCLQACVVILSSISSLRDELLVDDVISTLLRYVKSNDDLTASTSLSILSLLSKDCPVDKISIFQSAIPVARSALNRDATTHTDVVNFLCNFLPHPDIVEIIIKQTTDEEPSILSAICRLCINQVESNSKRSCFVSKVLQFITALLCHYDVILNKTESYSEVFHLINMVLSSLLHQNSSSERDVMIKQWLYPFHACFNIHYPIPGLSRNPRHLLLFWSLRDFMSPHSDNSWTVELKRNLDHETEALDNF